MDAVAEQRECTMVPGPNGATGGTRGGVAPGNTVWKLLPRSVKKKKLFPVEVSSPTGNFNGKLRLETS